MTVTSINLTVPSSAQAGSTVSIASTIQNNDSISHSVECRIIQGSTTLLDENHTITPGAQYTFTTSLVMPSSNVTIQCQSLVQASGGAYFNDNISSYIITSTPISGSYRYSIGQSVMVVENPSNPMDANYGGLFGTVASQFSDYVGAKYSIALTGGQRLAGSIPVYEVDLSVNAFTVSYTIQGSGTVSISSAPPDSSPYNQGDVITVTATPNSGATFTGWYENSVLVSTNLSYSFTIESNIGLVAVFTTQQAVNYTLTVGITGPGGYQSNPPVGSIAAGTQVTLTAMPYTDGAVFVGWYNGISLITTSTVYTFTINSNMNLGAVFNYATSVNVTPNPVVQGNNITVTVTGFKANSPLTLTVVETGGGWSKNSNSSGGGTFTNLGPINDTPGNYTMRVSDGTNTGTVVYIVSAKQGYTNLVITSVTI